VPEAERVPSPHIQWKETLLSTLPWLLVPLTYQKIYRPSKRAWDIAGPIKRGETNQWIQRLRRGAAGDGPITQVFLTLPEPGDDIRLEERLALTLQVVHALIEIGPKETRFSVSTGLVLPGADSRPGNAITVIDGEAFDPLTEEQLARLFAAAGLDDA
jgi:hypothetical protein